METNQKPKKRAQWALLSITIIASSMLVTFLISSWLSGRTTNVSAEDNIETTSYLSCSTNSTHHLFFKPENMVSAEQLLKITFKNDRPNDVNYDFKSTFASSDWAKQADASMHAQYNIYMGDQGANAESLTPLFDHIDNVAHVNLYADKFEITKATAPFFVLSPDEVTDFYSSSSEQIQKIYQNKSFSCSLIK